MIRGTGTSTRERRSLKAYREVVQDGRSAAMWVGGALLITLEPPTAPMAQEAVAAGFYEPEAFPGTQFPRVQIATIEDILDGNGPQIPRLGLSEAPTFRRAPRRRRGGVDPQRML